MRRASITLIAVLGVTAGITAAALDVIAAYLWRPLPYPESHRLAVVEFPRPNGPGPRDLARIDWTGVHAFAELALASDIDAFTVIGAGAPFSVDGRWMTADGFAAFGAVPAAGRFFTATEAARGEPLAVIGYQVWKDRYDGRLSAIGQTISVRATLRQGALQSHTIIGVLPPSFWHLEDRTSLILPLKSPAAPIALRLRDGISLQEAESRLTALVRTQIAHVGPGWSASVRLARDAHVDRIRPMLAATGWGVALLAVVAFANLVFLQMARGVARQREIAVRSVLGASATTLLRQLLSEGAAMGAGAAALGLAVTTVLLRGGVPAIERYFGRVVPGGAGGLGSDPLILATTAAGCVASGMLLSLVSLAAARRPALQMALAGHPASTDTPARATARQVIVGLQVAVAFCLLVGAGLMIRTAWHLGRVDVGFEPDRVLSANVALDESRYRSVEERRRFFATLVERLERLPEVTEAGLTNWLPFRVGPAFSIEPDGGAGPASTGASIQGVNPRYFAALRIPLVEGRLLTDEDRPDRERVAVISRSLARAVWHSESAIDKTFRIRFSSDNLGRPGFGPFTVVGVVQDTLQSLVNATPPQVYFPFDQQPLATNAFLQLKTTRPPLEVAPAVGRALHEADPTLPLAAVSALATLVEAEGTRPRFLARVLAAFALVAVSMTVTGLYAVSAWIAQQRQREAALRVALGAERASVVLVLARRGLVAIAAGLAGGWIAAAPLSRLMASELHGVDATDLVTRGAVAVLLLAVSTLALWRPAWRAAGSNLSLLLRTD